MSFSSAFKNILVSPSSREQIGDSSGMMLSQGGCFTHEHGQVVANELELIEMTEVDYCHLQHFIQAHVEAQVGFTDGPDVRFHPSTEMAKETVGSTGISSLTSTKAIDLSTSNEDHCPGIPEEKTPVSYGQVPGYVLARIRAEESPAEPPTNGRKYLQTRSIPAARVCLEKRFNTVCAETSRQQDIQSAVVSNFLTILQQSVETVYSPVTNVCDQVIIPKPAEEQPLVNIEKDAVHCSQTKAAKAGPDAAGEPQHSTRKSTWMSLSQRRERHNNKERERRKRIRLCCDELNTLVPFCDTETDKVTTLQWTTAFLRYINKTYGDTFKEEFQKDFTHEKELSRKSSSGQDPIHYRMDETLSSIPLAAEQ